MDYKLRASSGQSMAVTFKPSNPSAYFNVLPPGYDEGRRLGGVPVSVNQDIAPRGATPDPGPSARGFGLVLRSASRLFARGAASGSVLRRVRGPAVDLEVLQEELARDEP